VEIFQMSVLETKEPGGKMQKEKSIARRAVEERGGLCISGARTDPPCEREAVVPQPYPGETEIVLCEEHALNNARAVVEDAPA
jgi:hypothetical protein